MVPSDGAVRVEASYDQEAFRVFTLAEIDVLFDSIEWTEGEKVLKEWVDQYMAVYGKGFAASMLEESDSFMSGSFILETEDPQEALRQFRDMNTGEAATGMYDLYKNMGMDMKVEYKENFKEHKGIPIHRMEMNFDMAVPGMDEEESVAFNEMFSNMNTDVAIVQSYLVYTMADSAIEDVIDRVLAGGTPDTPPLESRRKFGEGGSAYADVNIAGYVRMVSNILKNVPDKDKDKQLSEILSKMESALDKLAAAPPISVGLFSDDQKSKIKVDIPSELIQKISQAATSAFMPAPQ